MLGLSWFKGLWNVGRPAAMVPGSKISSRGGRHDRLNHFSAGYDHFTFGYGRHQQRVGVQCDRALYDSEHVECMPKCSDQNVNLLVFHIEFLNINRLH